MNFPLVWKHNISYCVHNPLLDSIISQFNPFHSRPSSFSIHVYILLHHMLSLSLLFSGYYSILYIPFTFSHACYTPKHLNYSMGYPLSSTFPRHSSVYLSQLPLSHILQLLKGQVSHPYFFDYYFSSISNLLHAENVVIQWANPYRPFPAITLCVFRIFPMRITYPLHLHSPPVSQFT